MEYSSSGELCWFPLNNNNIERWHGTAQDDYCDATLATPRSSHTNILSHQHALTSMADTLSLPFSACGQDTNVPCSGTQCLSYLIRLDMLDFKCDMKCVWPTTTSLLHHLTVGSGALHCRRIKPLCSSAWSWGYLARVGKKAKWWERAGKMTTWK